MTLNDISILMDFLVISYSWHCSLDNLFNNFQFLFLLFPSFSSIVIRSAIGEDCILNYIFHMVVPFLQILMPHGVFNYIKFVLFNEVDALNICRIFFFLVVWKRLDFFAMSIEVPHCYLFKL